MPARKPAVPLSDSREAAQPSRLLRACRCAPVDATPIWLMRQAGRYLPAYRELRERHGLLEMIKNPALACAVTLLPLDACELDAAIIFADILPPLEGMGLSLEFVQGEGPALGNLVRTADDVARLRVVPPEESLWFTLEAIKLARAELDTRGVPLIGFSGAPFTLATYAVEGGASHTYQAVKSLMMSEPDTWHALMGKLSEVVGHYLLAQARAGAQVLQLFDSWVGQVAPDDYRQMVMPYTRQAIAIARAGGVPIIHFTTQTSGMLDVIRDAGGDVISVDWRIDLDTAWRRLGKRVAIQGNLDPLALLAPWPELRARARLVLDRAAGRPGHIFNLGHGILPGTPVDHVKRLVDFVHEYRTG
jgi:uroporphyrinogen decarboxylase